MITKFQEFINEDYSPPMGTPLRKYFLKNSLNHENIVGKKVVTSSGDVFYIKSIDEIHDKNKLPFQILCSSRPESEYGHYVNTDELYVPDDIDFKEAQAGVQTQIQESFDPMEIIKQIGGHKAMYMMGIKSGRLQLISDTKNNKLILKPKVKNKHGINHIEITLNGKDLYDVEFSRIRNVNVGLNFDKPSFKQTIIKKVEDVYFDELPKLIENTMEIYLKLF